MAKRKQACQSWPESAKLYRIVSDDETFHIGQSYDDDSAESVECIKCGGRSFNVGVGSHYTAIRCVVCHWENCIHDG